MTWLRNNFWRIICWTAGLWILWQLRVLVLAALVFIAFACVVTWFDPDEPDVWEPLKAKYRNARREHKKITRDWLPATDYFTPSHLKEILPYLQERGHAARKWNGRIFCEPLESAKITRHFYRKAKLEQFINAEIDGTLAKICEEQKTPRLQMLVKRFAEDSDWMGRYLSENF